jgi:hypothetical protein
LNDLERRRQVRNRAEQIGVIEIPQGDADYLRREADDGFFQFLSNPPLKAEIKNSNLMTGHFSRAGHIAEADWGRC